MPPRWLVVPLVLASVSAAPHSSAQVDGLRTRAEISGYEETSTYADVERIVGGLAARPNVHLERFGRSEEGRELPLLVISDPGVTTPEAARKLGRPIVLVQANIHAGEVEGKEAALMLARRLVDGELAPLARQLVLLIAPLYNADGNERVSVEHRPAQNGPIAGVGTRENANGLDLNRDYMKLDAAESRALVGLMNRWDPHVVVDLHTTNGSYHGYHLTYAPTLNPNADARLIAFARDTLLPQVRTAMADAHGFRTYYYGNFAPEGGGGRESAHVDPASPGDVTWRTFDHRPRFGNNYVGLRNRIAILSEAYSYLDFPGRVAATAAFVEEVWRGTARHAKQVLTLTAQADRAMAGPRAAAAKPADLGLDFEIRALPDPVEILLGDVGERLNPRSGRPMREMTAMAAPVRMKDYGVFAATRARPLPRGWLIPRALAHSPRLASALDRLRWHGIQMDEVKADTQMDVERFVVASVSKAPRVIQGHQEARVTGTIERAQLSVQAGALVVPGRQRLARLAFYLLEPDSDDGLATWNLVEEGLAPGQAFPIYRLR
ncbi:MAG TPA: M14 family metallopeptidase [Vicinamibacterales bacterium]|nr:M14 family metallopeptidase [Vicinamibacterales bacterium]